MRLKTKEKDRGIPNPTSYTPYKVEFVGGLVLNRRVFLLVILACCRKFNDDSRLFHNNKKWG